MKMSQAQAAQAKMMKAQSDAGPDGPGAHGQARQAQAAKAGMAAAMVTAATLAATDAGECSPYLAKWMMTRNPLAKMAVRSLHGRSERSTPDHFRELLEYLK